MTSTANEGAPDKSRPGLASRSRHCKKELTGTLRETPKAPTPTPRGVLRALTVAVGRWEHGQRSLKSLGVASWLVNRHRRPMGLGGRLR